MLGRIAELIRDPEMWRWAGWRFKHPVQQKADRGVPLFKGTPPYLGPQDVDFVPEVNDVPLSFPKLGINKDLTIVDTLPPQVAIEIASREHILDTSRIEEYFELKFSDPEDVNAIFRFAWIPALVVQNESVARFLIDQLILLWLEKISRSQALRDDHHPAWQPYTVSERIANWGMYLCRTQSHLSWSSAQMKSFKMDLSSQAQKILTRLEYYGESLTGNHLSNDGRGLLWCALLLNDRKLASVAGKILTHEHARIIQSDGMLREGSSHYQYLITRNYLEAYWISEQMELKEFSHFLKPRLALMLDGCRMVRLQGIHPHVGDISPDVTPSWLDQVPEAGARLLGSAPGAVQPSHGWASLYFSEVPAPQEPALKLRQSFGRLDGDGFSVLVHVNPDGGPDFSTHAHLDSGSPVIIYKGKPIVIDPGRKNYLPESEARKQAIAHSCILIDGASPEIYLKRVFGPAYLRYRRGPQPSLTLDPATSLLQVQLGSYSRQHIGLVREYQIKNGRCILGAKLAGSGEHKVVWCLQTPAAGQPLEIQWPEGGSVQTFQNTASSRYGEQTPCTTLQWHSKVQLPWSGQIILSPKGMT